MTYQPPVDQRIVDEFFQLSAHRKTRDIAWVYAMVSTYGIKPDDLHAFKWETESTINICRLRRPLQPLHPQWAIIFDLKEKQPSNLESRLDKILLDYYKAISLGQISFNITDLILAHKLRKQHYRASRRSEDLAFASAS